MELKELLDSLAKITTREKSNTLFWALWSYAKNQKNKDIRNQCIYECYCLVNNYVDSWDKRYEEFYNRFLNLSVNEYGELRISDTAFKTTPINAEPVKPNMEEAVREFLKSFNKN